MQYLMAALIGAFAGLTSGLFGVGGGVIMVPAMMYFMGADIRTAVGTSLVVIIPTAVVGSFKHFQNGNVDWRLASMLAPTAILMGFAGARLVPMIPADNLKKAFGGFLLLVGFRLIFAK